MQFMSKYNNIGLIRYEYMAYVYLTNTCNVDEISLTKDDFTDMKSQDDQIKWVPVENVDIDIIDTIGENGDEVIEGTKSRICGLFDAEPLDWRYARITVSDNADTKHCYAAIARMPRSPIIPVVFDVNK